MRTDARVQGVLLIPALLPGAAHTDVLNLVTSEQGIAAAPVAVRGNIAFAIGFAGGAGVRWGVPWPEPSIAMTGEGAAVRRAYRLEEGRGAVLVLAQTADS